MKKRIACLSTVMVLLLAFVFPPETVHGAYSRFYELVLESNRNARNGETDPSRYLEMDDAEMQALSDEIVKGIQGDYEKVRAIHDWTCQNIYYDYDAAENAFSAMEVEGIEEAIAIDQMSVYEFLITYKRGVCRYYARIFSALVRAQGIPCMTVYGYAENVSQSSGGYLVDRREQKIYPAGDRWTKENYNNNLENHAWNEAYVDGRWIIVDTTWDSQNEYRNGQYLSGSVRQSYFDISEQNLAKDHRIITYGLGESTKTDGPTLKNAWSYDAGKWYYFGSDGRMAANRWVQDGQKWYYMQSDGAMATGWRKLDGVWYYFRNSGVMVSGGWQRIRGQWYYFYDSGVMAANATIDGYKIGTDGAWIQ